MRRLSSAATFLHKRLFPGLWFTVLGAIALSAISSFVQNPAANTDRLMAIVVPAIMAVFGYFLFRALLFDLLDAVYLDGDEIVVQNSGEEDRFPVSNIINVSATQFVSPDRITLSLREPCKFGEEITFSPPMRMLHFGRHPLAKEIIQLANAQPAR